MAFQLLKLYVEDNWEFQEKETDPDLVVKKQ
jgi:hypothetical protein